nr:TlpA disulfide reductase family protein [Sphingomonas bacterium]
MLALAAPASAGRKPQPVVGEMAPDATLKLVDGSSVSLLDLRGQVVVLNFWATWCVPCRRELPLLDAYYRQQKPHGLAVYAITTEDSLPLYLLRPLFKAMAIPPVRALKGPYETIKAVPTNYIIDRAGRIRYMKAAAFDLDDLNRELAPLLQEPAPVAAAK